MKQGPDENQPCAVCDTDVAMRGEEADERGSVTHSTFFKPASAPPLESLKPQPGAVYIVTIEAPGVPRVDFRFPYDRAAVTRTEPNTSDSSQNEGRRV